jgi:hypothetical protein
MRTLLFPVDSGIHSSPRNKPLKDLDPGTRNRKETAETSARLQKNQAERIALSKVKGGKIRNSELQTPNGAKLSLVYVITPGSKNAKEVREPRLAETSSMFEVQA